MALVARVPGSRRDQLWPWLLEVSPTNAVNRI